MILRTIIDWFKKPSEFKSVEVTGNYIDDALIIDEIIKTCRLRRKLISKESYDIIQGVTCRDDLLDIAYFWSEYSSIPLMKSRTNIPDEVYESCKNKSRFFWNGCDFYKLSSGNYLVNFVITPFVRENIRKNLKGKLDYAARHNH